MKALYGVWIKSIKFLLQSFATCLVYTDTLILNSLSLGNGAIKLQLGSVRLYNIEEIFNQPTYLCGIFEIFKCFPSIYIVDILQRN